MTKNIYMLLAILASAAVLHFVPPVKAYLLTTWPIFGLGFGVAILLFLLADWRENRIETIAKWHWLLLAIYTLHQFEEHGVDLFGRAYYFITYANEFLALQGADAPQLTPSSLYQINTLTIWIGFAIAIWASQRFTWPGYFAAALVLTNGLFHIGIALGRWEYNPGVMTALILFLPISWLYFKEVVRAKGWPPVLIAIGFGIFGHLLLRALIGLGEASESLSLFVWMSLALTPLALNVIWLKINQT